MSSDAEIELGLNQAPDAVLQNIVKEAQRQNLAGEFGNWKNFLLHKSAGSPGAGKTPASNPASHSREMVLEFVKSLFGNKAQRGLLGSLLQQCTDLLTKRRAPVIKEKLIYPSTGIWHLVNVTQTHEKYSSVYKFPSKSSGWVRQERCMPDFDSEPSLVALDCEMCHTTASPRELLSVSVVDRHGTVLLEKLVKPAGEIVDLKTEMTGIKAAQLEGVTATRQEVAAEVAALLSGQSVLVGHSVHHDLRSLQLDHWPVIDTAYVFSYANMPEYTPSLALLASDILKQRLREAGQPHDARKDASAAMELVLYAQDPGACTTLSTATVKAAKDDLMRLLVHKIPKGCTPEDIKGVFQAGTVVSLIGKLPGDVKVLVEFQNASITDNAFASLPGKKERDSGGRFQKSVPLLTGSYKGQCVSIRRMATHNGCLLQASKSAGKTSEKRKVDKAAKVAVGGSAGHRDKKRRAA